MKLKVSLVRSGGSSADLMLTVEPNTAVADIARQLRDSDLLRGNSHPAAGSVVSLRVHEPDGDTVRLIDASVPISESGIASGSTVSIAAASARSGGSGGSGVQVAGQLRVVDGADRGKEFDLNVGANNIGRDPHGRVVLSDSLVSKTHARVNVSDVVEIIDLGSANGTQVNGVQVDRTVLVAGDVVTLGDTAFVVTANAQAAAKFEAGVVEFNRSPRLDPSYPGRKLAAPEVPERQRAQHLPILAMFVPLIMGAVLYAINPSPAAVAFVALSPLLLLGTFLDGRLQANREWKRMKKEFEDSIASLTEEIEAEKRVERAGRLAEAPSTAEILTDIESRGPLLWTRRPEHGAFLGLRIGRGEMPSRIELELPAQRKGIAEHWTMIQDVAAQAVRVDDVPVAERLVDCGSIGVAGSLDAARAVARSLVLQLVGLHSPAELAIAAIASNVSSPAWDWLKWLPHTGSPHGPLAGPPLASDGPPVLNLVAEIEDLVSRRTELAGSSQHPYIGLPALLLVVEDDAPGDRARLIEIGEHGPQVGVHLLWIAPSLSRLPAICRTFVDIHAVTGDSIAGYVRTGYGVHPVVCESIGDETAARVARSLSPVVDSGAKLNDDSDLPRSVSLLSLLGQGIATDPDEVILRWQQTSSILSGPMASADIGKKKSTLRAVFGQAATENFAIDLRADGPHALVGGTTGAGKSEFLQAWVLGMASAHSPQRVTFLFIDYKGGAAFADCINLPHSVGLVTDLSQHLVRRALTSLRAELTYREHLLNTKKVKDLIELERTGDPEAPPSLVIIVDEFAALVTEVPEFVDGVVDVAQRGRSLGLHLVLATQRPAGVIKDNLRANTNLRVALRMADEENSADVLGTPEAAFFDPAVPGRGAAKTGPGRIRPFQTAYAGGWTGDIPESNRVTIEELRFGPPAPWERPADPELEAQMERITSGPTDIKRIVETVRRAASTAAIPVPRKPWLTTMSDVYDIAKLPTRRTDESLVFGVVDEPSKQEQNVISFNPDRDGNMSVIGTGGSGKTTALRAIASAAANTVRGGPIEIYGLDFAGGGLKMLETLPHVGSIVSGDDEERLGRLLRLIAGIIDERSAQFADARASTIVEYRKITKQPDLPRIVLLLDGMGAFRDAYETAFSTPWFEVFSRIATDGRQVGVHIVLTGDRPGAIPNSLSASIQRQLVLRLANPDEYSILGVPGDVLSTTSPAGRGIIDGLETQVAVRGGDPNVAVQAQALENLASAMRESGVPEASAIERLSELVPLADLPETTEGLPTVGIADATLSPIGLEAAGGFIVSGPPGSGRTTALATIATALKRAQPQRDLYLLSTRRSQLTRLPGWAGVAEGPEAVQKLAAKLNGLLDSAKPKPSGMAIFLEHLGELSDDPSSSEIENLIRAALRQEQFVVGESESSTWSQAYTLGQLLRASRRGLLLQPDDGDGDQLLNTDTGRVRRNSMPPGRGFLIGGGRALRLQIAMARL